jgi:hypothetical protein
MQVTYRKCVSPALNACPTPRGERHGAPADPQVIDPEASKPATSHSQLDAGRSHRTAKQRDRSHDGDPARR